MSSDARSIGDVASVAGKVCLVTGAGNGIGRAIARELASRGASVAAADIDLEAARETVEGVASAVAIRCDVRVHDEVVDAVERTVDRYGALDVLVNNAGIHESALLAAPTVESLTDDAFQRVWEVNVRGTWWCTRAAAPHLRRSTRNPVVLNAGSRTSYVAVAGSPVYAATKGAIVQLTNSVALDLAPDVRCNCYVPGTTESGMVTQYLDAVDDPEAAERALAATNLVPRLGRPEDVARLVAFLASDDAVFVNGAAVRVDGGSLSWRGHRT